MLNLSTEITLPLEHFSNSIPGFQTAWDSTSLSTLKTCPRLYYYKTILGLQPKGEDNPHLKFGTLYHKGLEFYDHFRIVDKMEPDEAQKATLKALLKEAGSYGIVVNEDFIPESSPNYAQLLEDNPEATREWRTWESTDSYKNIHTLIRGVLWYIERFKEDNLEVHVLQDGTPAVELSFRYPYGLPGVEDDLLLCGHIDKLVNFYEGFWIVDRKTTKSQLNSKYFDNFDPDTQMRFYAMSGAIVLNEPIAGVIIDATQIAVGFSRYDRGLIHYSPGILDEFLLETDSYIYNANRYAQANFWPQNETACDKYGGCKFRAVCRAAKGVRSSIIQTHFKQEHWKPLENR